MLEVALHERGEGFAILLRGQTLIAHTPEQPFMYIGRGTPSIAFHQGNFDIKDDVEERVALRHATSAALTNTTVTVLLSRHVALEPELKLTIQCCGASAVAIEFDLLPPFAAAPSAVNRLWLRLHASPDEALWGAGTQLSYLNLRGRTFPLWTSEPGVGRDKSTHITFQADSLGRNAGGDYYKTSYPQPTFISSQKYALHVDTKGAYAEFDFSHSAFHELHFWAVPAGRMEIIAADSLISLVSCLSLKFGKQPRLPEWVQNGVILGLKSGKAHANEQLEKALRHGVLVSALWCEDWVGIRQTTFGRRLFWDWKWNEERYPDPKAWTASLRDRGIRFIGYVNPYLCNDGELYAEARALDYLVRPLDDDSTNTQDYVIDCGEFSAGIVDFTNPSAATWFSERIIKREMRDCGIDGWMADFGEYNPTNVKYFSGECPLLMHNQWPVLWAKVNAASADSDALFFMRSGGTGVQAHCPLLWAGDQSVDFSRHDGLLTAICAALSSGLMGNAYHHSDIGGFTSLYNNIRTKEVFMRWAELSAFTAVMRTHEGNRPEDNFQFYQDDIVLAHLAKMTRIYVALTPYRKMLADEAVEVGLPLQRPLFLHNEDDANTFSIQDEFMFGRDVLVAPVHLTGRVDWECYLPSGSWIHVWSQESFSGGQRVTVGAPLGQPPVFVRANADPETLTQLLALADC